MLKIYDDKNKWMFQCSCVMNETSAVSGYFSNFVLHEFYRVVIRPGNFSPSFTVYKWNCKIGGKVHYQLQ